MPRAWSGWRRVTCNLFHWALPKMDQDRFRGRSPARPIGSSGSGAGRDGDGVAWAWKTIKEASHPKPSPGTAEREWTSISGADVLSAPGLRDAATGGCGRLWGQWQAVRGLAGHGPLRASSCRLPVRIMLPQGAAAVCGSVLGRGGPCAGHVPGVGGPCASHVPGGRWWAVR